MKYFHIFYMNSAACLHFDLFFIIHIELEMERGIEDFEKQCYEKINITLRNNEAQEDQDDSIICDVCRSVSCCFFVKSKFCLLNFSLYSCTPVGINIKGFVSPDFGMFLLLDYCIENERGSVGMPLCRVLINISSKSSKIVYFSQNCYFHVM